MGAESHGLGAMPLKSQQSPAEGEFLFAIEEQPAEECLPALGGVPLLERTAGSLDVPGRVQRNLMDATVMESGKREAKATYQGGSGSHYEPPRFPSPG